MKIYVLDSSAILSGKPLNLDGKIVVPPSVEEEVMKKDPNLIKVLSCMDISFEHPSKESISLVKEAAEKLGETKRLSKVDVEIIAVALDNSRRGDVYILTDDYSIQNTSSLLGIKFKPVSEEGITRRFIWGYRCEGCKKYFKRFFLSCPICGSKLRTVVKKKTKVIK